LLLALALSGCMGSGSRYSDVPPPDYWYNGSSTDSHEHVAMSDQYSAATPTHDEGGRSYTYGAPSFTPADYDGCKITDRFDNRSTIAYNFDDRHQLAFNMAINDDGGSMGVSRAVVVFHYKFDAPKPSRSDARRAKCRYDSHWQGLVGSTYNELFLRDHNSVWTQMKDNGLDFWNK
jgi:hypothetical protein